MQEFARLEGDGFIWNKDGESLWVVPWRTNGVRVRMRPAISPF